MSSRTLIVLLAALGVLVALAFAVSVSEKEPASAGGGLLLPAIKDEINAIERVVVRTAGDNIAATLVRGETGWTVAERDNYPADTGRLRKLLIELAEARILEEKTSNPEYYDRLKVEDIAKETAGGVELELTAGKSVTKLIVGSVQGGGERCYVRRSGEKPSWLVSGGLAIARDATGWLDKSLVDIAAEKVSKVTITFPDGSSTRLAREKPDAPDLAVLDMPAGRELGWPGVTNAVAGALAELAFDAVRPAAGFDPGGVKPIVARFETSDGEVVEVSTYTLPAGEQVRFSVSKDEALQARLANWVYTLPDYKGEQFTKRLEDLLGPSATADAP